jgi:type II secretory pathway pseudopilin PulG
VIRRVPRARRHARRQEGFTLIELTVSLLAGLIVALGIVGLSRDATHTFHEEMRGSAAEANLRTAVDRLRADLARAGYMSTGNVITDPMISKLPGVVDPINAAFLGLARLSSIYLNQGNQAGLPTPLSTTNGVSPDAIDIAGNMTTTDQYEVSVIQPAAGGCQQIFLNAQSPSMYRVLGLGAQGPAELNNLFQPTPPGIGGQFAVRLVDKTGHSQFLATCATNPTGIGGPDGATPFISVDPQTPVLMANVTGTVGGLSGYGSGALVNPVQIVRWQILPATAEPAQYSASPLVGQPLSPTVTDPTKYDLVRSYVDALTGNPIAATMEVVAEYAVDLVFAFSVDQGSSLQPAITTFPFDMPPGTGSPLWALNIVNAPLNGIDPARIRSVRVRLATRTSEPDRTLNVAVPNPIGPSMYRYCMLAGGCSTTNTAGVLQYARVRTVTAEVSLPNQSRNYY